MTVRYMVDFERNAWSAVALEWHTRATPTFLLIDYFPSEAVAFVRVHLASRASGIRNTDTNSFVRSNDFFLSTRAS